MLKQGLPQQSEAAASKTPLPQAILLPTSLPQVNFPVPLYYQPIPQEQLFLEVKLQKHAHQHQYSQLLFLFCSHQQEKENLTMSKYSQK